MFLVFLNIFNGSERISAYIKKSYGYPQKADYEIEYPDWSERIIWVFLDIRSVPWATQNIHLSLQ